MLLRKFERGDGASHRLLKQGFTAGDLTARLASEFSSLAAPLAKLIAYPNLLPVLKGSST